MLRGTFTAPLLACFFKYGRLAVDDGPERSVYCVECGCFSLVHKTSREVVCADRNYRELGHIPHDPGGYAIYESEPLCGCESPAFTYVELLSVEERKKTLVTCRRFVKYQPALSPKDHLEMSLLQEVERRTQEWRTEDLVWRKQVEAVIETRHQEIRRDAGGRDKWTWAIAIGAGVAATISALVLLATFLSRP